MNQNTKRILVVASDYGLIRTVRDALTHQSLTLQVGYSHIDGLYALENGDFDAVVVDALMVKHRDGQSTLVKLAQLNHAIPIIGLANDPAMMDGKGASANISIVYKIPFNMCFLSSCIFTINSPKSVLAQANQERVNFSGSSL